MDKDDRTEQKRRYAGKRIYDALVLLKTAIYEAQGESVDVGTFAELDVNNLIAEARVIGSIPVWNAEETPIGKTLKYPQGTTGVN